MGVSKSKKIMLLVIIISRQLEFYNMKFSHIYINVLSLTFLWLYSLKIWKSCIQR